MLIPVADLGEGPEGGEGGGGGVRAESHLVILWYWYICSAFPESSKFAESDIHSQASRFSPRPSLCVVIHIVN